MTDKQHPDLELLNQMRSPWSGGEAPFNGPGALEAAGVDEDSAFRVAQARTDHIALHMTAPTRDTPEEKEKVRLCAAWMDGLITGLRFMRARMEPQIVADIEGSRRSGGVS